MQTIKKYANRKLYHTNRKQYITLDGIAALIQAGDDTIAGVRRSFWSAIGGTSVVDSEIRRRLEQLHADGRIDAAELARLHDLLLHPQPDSSHAEGSEMPSHRDIVHLRDQVDALTAVVDQLLAERGRRTEDEGR